MGVDGARDAGDEDRRVVARVQVPAAGVVTVIVVRFSLVVGDGPHWARLELFRTGRRRPDRGARRGVRQQPRTCRS
ncbi:hypothetical protein GCM10023082_56870 [Streptomyces tremellae]|uniref:Uncharacterized protein n=1 Tax=Streptomyces tremellae TaxID=1124239 RepID=A0ABP7G3B7_9ACTN